MVRGGGGHIHQHSLAFYFYFFAGCHSTRKNPGPGVQPEAGGPETVLSGSRMILWDTDSTSPAASTPRGQGPLMAAGIHCALMGLHIIISIKTGE